MQKEETTTTAAAAAAPGPRPAAPRPRPTTTTTAAAAAAPKRFCRPLFLLQAECLRILVSTADRDLDFLLGLAAALDDLRDQVK